MTTNNESLKKIRQRKYLARDFDGLRAMMLEYARKYYPDKIKDFSESSMGGMLLDMAAYVGDNLSFYLDHLYSELNYETAVETQNIERAIRTAGVPITGAAPAIVPVTCYIEIPSKTVNNAVVPDPDAIPIVQSGTVFQSDNSVNFNLLEDIDFSKKKSDGTYVSEIAIGKRSTTGAIQTFIMSSTGLCVSGDITTETFDIQTFVPFRTVTLAYPNVTEIVSVTDGYGNSYYEVSDLTNDVVYKNVLNTNKDNDYVRDALKVIPAPYRFTTQGQLSNRKTVLRFGGGSADTLEDDVIPDPSEFAIALPYSKTFSIVSVNPEKLLSTKTLGVISANTTLSITYRYGGGLDHNVPVDNVRTVKTLKMFFPKNPSSAVAARIRGSIECTNKVEASGGEDALSVDDLKSLIPSVKNSQNRFVTRPDLLARIYTIPSNFGKVFRAAIRSNPNNPLSTQLFIISRSPDEKLILSPDTLKTNLVKYLNPYRMIVDAIDILDARIINLKLNFEIVVDPSLNKSLVLQSIITKLNSKFDIKNYHIDQPIVISDVVNAIFSVNGVISINGVTFSNVTGMIDNRTYSDETFDIDTNTKNGIILPPPGGIFEIRYREVDIVGRAIL